MIEHPEQLIGQDVCITTVFQGEPGSCCGIVTEIEQVGDRTYANFDWGMAIAIDDTSTFEPAACANGDHQWENLAVTDDPTAAIWRCTVCGKEVSG